MLRKSTGRKGFELLVIEEKILCRFNKKRKFILSQVSLEKFYFRVFWIIAFILSLIGCVCMIYKLYNKWQATPVIVSYSERYTRIWEIPFPAITVCPASAYSLLDPHHLWSLNESGKVNVVAFVSRPQPDISNRFPFCIWNNEQISCERIFSEIRTDVGECHTFNMLNHDELLQADVWDERAPLVMQLW